jgi:cytochrome c6
MPVAASPLARSACHRPASAPAPAPATVLVLGMAFLLGCLLVLPAAARAEPASGAQLFEAHCAGCHLQGGNIIRRRKTLKLAALEREGIASPAAIAAIAAGGVGQMSGYGEVLGPDGSEAVAAWVWRQAQEGWPRG